MTTRIATALTLTLAACAPAAPAPTPVTLAPTTTTATTAAATTTTAQPRRTVTTRAARAAVVVAPAPPQTDVEAAICAAWGDECGRALRVARCESGLDPSARNGPHAGLFQVNVRIHAARIARLGFTEAQMLEAGPNIVVARALWGEQGWRPWTCAA